MSQFSLKNNANHAPLFKIKKEEDNNPNFFLNEDFKINIKNKKLFEKLIKISNSVEKGPTFNYRKLNCPICGIKNPFDSLLFINCKEFILYLAYILTFIPECYKDCKNFFQSKNNIINFFKINQIKKSFFIKKNPIIMCRKCLILIMNDIEFVNIFAKIFGFFEKNNNKMNSTDDISLTESESSSLDIPMKDLNNFNSKKLEKNNDKNTENNKNYENKELKNCSEKKNNIIEKNNNKENLNLEETNIIKNFRQIYDSVKDSIVNISLQINKFHSSEKKETKKIIEDINCGIKDLFINFKILLFFQNLYLNEISNLMNTIPNVNSQYLLKINQIMFIKNEFLNVSNSYKLNIYSFIEFIQNYCKQIISDKNLI